MVIVPGILGYYFRVDELAGVMEEAPSVSAQIWDWTAMMPSQRVLLLDRAIDNLQDIKKNRTRARRLANELIEWRKLNQSTGLYVVAVSGGAAIALWACESLPPDFQVEQIILLSPAVSSDWDLSAACRRTRDGIYVYSSTRDDTLKDKTREYGTMDGKRTSAAGYTGEFTTHPECAMKLRHLEWTDEMAPLGNRGDHFGCQAPNFVREYVLPVVASSKSDPRWRLELQSTD